MGVQDEGRAIRDVLIREMPQFWDGRKCVLFLREHDYQWRQMEWIGFYFEYAAREMLKKELGGSEGPAFGKTTLDYRRDYIWDFKAHQTKAHGKDEAIMNDCEAANRCIEDHGGLGFVIAAGSAVLDEKGEFRRWHDQLKGQVSKFTKERTARGAPSRRRKVSFTLERFDIFFLRNQEDVEKAVREGWLSGDFQIGFRNAGGSSRRPKYKVQVNRIPSWCRI